MLTAAIAAAAMGSCPGLWSHTSTDPERSSFMVEVAPSTLLMQYDDGGGLNGRRTTNTVPFTYQTDDAGVVVVSDCADGSAKITVEERTYDLTLVSADIFPETWCSQGIRGFGSVTSIYRQLTDYGPSKGEFETSADYLSRRNAARTRTLSDNQFVPILANVYLSPYNADKGGFPFTVIELNEARSESISLDAVGEAELLLPVGLDQARRMRSARGSSISATIFLVAQIDTNEPVRTFYDQRTRWAYRAIRAIDIRCMSASFPE